MPVPIAPLVTRDEGHWGDLILPRRTSLPLTDPRYRNLFENDKERNGKEGLAVEVQSERGESPFDPARFQAHSENEPAAVIDASIFKDPFQEDSSDDAESQHSSSTITSAASASTVTSGKSFFGASALPRIPASSHQTPERSSLSSLPSPQNPPSQERVHRQAKFSCGRLRFSPYPSPSRQLLKWPPLNEAREEVASNDSTPDDGSDAPTISGVSSTGEVETILGRTAPLPSPTTACSPPLVALPPNVPGACGGGHSQQLSQDYKSTALNSGVWVWVLETQQMNGQWGDPDVLDPEF